MSSQFLNADTQSLDVTTDVPSLSIGETSNGNHVNEDTLNLDTQENLQVDSEDHSTFGVTSVPLNEMNSNHNDINTKGSMSGIVNSASAVYRFFEIDESIGLKKREESSHAKCSLCVAQGKPVRKTMVRFSKSVTSNLWRHLKENHPDVYAKHAREKKSILMHSIVSAKKRGRKKKQTTDSIDGDKELNLEDVKLTKRQRKYTSKGLLNSNTDIELGSEKVEQIYNAIGRFCLVEMLPVNVILSPAFSNIINIIAGQSYAFLKILAEKDIHHSIQQLAAKVTNNNKVALEKIELYHYVFSKWENNRLDNLEFAAISVVGLSESFEHYQFWIQVINLMSYSSHLNQYVKINLDDDSILQNVLNPQRIITIESPDGKKRNNLKPTSSMQLKFIHDIVTLLKSSIVSIIDPTPAIDTSMYMSLDEYNLPQSSPLLNALNVADISEYVESIPYLGNRSHQIYSLEEEIETPILSYFQSVWDKLDNPHPIIKVFCILSHLRQSPNARIFLSKIARNDLGIDDDIYEGEMANNLRDIVLDFDNIDSILMLILRMREMLERYFLLHEANQSIYSQSITLMQMSSMEWSMIESYKASIKPVADVIAKLVAEKYAVASLIVPSMHTLLNKLKINAQILNTYDRSSNEENIQVSKSSTQELVLQEFSDQIHDHLSKSFGFLFDEPDASWTSQQMHVFKLLWISTALDPRTRTFVVNAPISQIALREIIKKETVALEVFRSDNNITDYPKDAGFDIPLEPSSFVLHSDFGRSTIRNSGDVWEDLQENLDSCSQKKVNEFSLHAPTKSTVETAKSSHMIEVELSFFQEEDRIALDADPLFWWRTVRTKYPFLAKMARYVLSLPYHNRKYLNPVEKDRGFIQNASKCFPGDQLTELLCAAMNLSANINKYPSCIED